MGQVRGFDQWGISIEWGGHGSIPNWFHLLGKARD